MFFHSMPCNFKMASIDENSSTALISPLTLSSMGETNADYHRRANDVVCGASSHTHNASHHHQHHHHLPIDSATTYLLKKAASMLWRMVKEIDWDESARALADLNALVSSAISLHFYSLVRVLHVVSDFGVDCSYYDTNPCDGNEASPTMIRTHASNYTSSYEPTTMDIPVADGLAFQSSGLSLNDSNRRMDFVITQLEVSRMKPDSFNDDIEGISSSILPRIPTTSTALQLQDDQSLNGSTICSSCNEDEEDVDDFLLRNADIIEDYIANTENSNEEAAGGVGVPLVVGGDLPHFSWMIVPTDPNEDLERQLSRSSSMCKSNADSIVDNNGKIFTTPSNTFDDDAICQVPYQDDDGGDANQLCVLCQHDDDVEMRRMPPSSQNQEIATNDDDDLQVELSTPPSPPSHSPTSAFKRFGYFFSGHGN